MNKKFDKRLVLILRIILFAVGAVLGSLAIWQFFAYYPDKMTGAIRIGFYIVSAALPAVVLMLSTKPVLYLASALGGVIKKACGRTKPMDIAGALVGLLIGFLLAYLSEALLSLVLPIFVLRVIIDIFVGLITAYIATLLCTKWFAGHETDLADTSENESLEPMLADGGFLLTASALKNEKIEQLCENWLSAPVYVLSRTVDALMDDASNPESAEAIGRYRRLQETGLIKQASVKSDGQSAWHAAALYASAKRLKAVVSSPEEIAAIGDEEPRCVVLFLSELFQPVEGAEKVERD